MPRKDQGWITFQTSEEERQLLEAICQISRRTKTAVLMCRCRVPMGVLLPILPWERVWEVRSLTQLG